MRNKYIENFEQAQLEGKTIPTFRAGDTLRVAVNIKEGEKVRVQNYEGLCIAIRGQGSIESITVLRRGRIRRAKLFYLRELKGKAARIKELRRK